MNALDPKLQPSVAAALAQWHAMLAQRDLSKLRGLLHDDAVFRSPMAFSPTSAPRP